MIHRNYFAVSSVNLFLCFTTITNIFAKNLPTGQHLLSTLRSNMTYVDKTGHFLKLINSTDSFVFCARPPGFGKSFFLDMLQLIFNGVENKEIFRGTEIYRSNYSWPKRPILYFDFDNLKHGLGELEDELQRKIIDMENVFNIRSRLSESFVHELSNLIQQIFLGSQKEVVVLVDNYDAPVVKCLPNDTNIAAKNFDVLRQFFGCLKSLDVYIKLAFVTGISQFPMKKNQGLEMDNFMDVTLYENYTAAMEFTEDEMNAYFRQFYENATVEEPLLREKSFGYRFSDINQMLYHPRSVVDFFKRKNTTENPKPAEYMLTAFKERPQFLFTMKNITGANLILSDIKTMTSSEDIIPMLFQNGFLTIKNCNLHVKKKRSCYYYDLGFATSYTEDYFLNSVLEDILIQGNVTANSGFSELRQYVMNRKLKEFVETTNAYLQRVNYGGRDEKIYRNLIECLLRVAGFSATWRQRLERANLYEVDCIFELLMDRDADDALHTMVSKDHKLSITDGRFKGGVVVGLNFDTKRLTINGCEVVWFNEQNNKTDYHYHHKLEWDRPTESYANEK